MLFYNPSNYMKGFHLRPDPAIHSAILQPSALGLAQLIDSILRRQLNSQGGRLYSQSAVGWALVPIYKVTRQMVHDLHNKLDEKSFQPKKLFLRHGGMLGLEGKGRSLALPYSSAACSLASCAAETAFFHPLSDSPVWGCHSVR